MTTWRELCRELIDSRGPDYYRALERARKALADGPAVPEGREPAAVVGEPSDEELLRLGQSHYISYTLSDGTAISLYQEGTDIRPELLSFARAVLARWGRPAPAPAEGEVAELVAELRRICFDVAPCDSDTITRVAELLRHQAADVDALRGRLSRAISLLSADLLERQAAPVPVSLSERLPGPEDCDAEGRCWLFSKVEKEWRLIDAGNPGVPHLKYCFSQWLPAHALPLPVATPAGQEGA